jgi:hypothetical protein
LPAKIRYVEFFASIAPDPARLSVTFVAETLDDVRDYGVPGNEISDLSAHAQRSLRPKKRPHTGAKPPEELGAWPYWRNHIFYQFAYVSK